MPKVFITTEALFHAPGPHEELLTKAGFEIAYPSRPELPTAADTVRELAAADAVLAGSDVYSETVFAKLRQLRVVSRMGVGYDRIDVPAATRHNVAVTITPDGNHQGVAEHTLALLLAIARGVPQIDRGVRSGNWPKPRLAPLRGKTLGLVGLGRIGRGVAARASAFGMRLLACDPYVTTPPDDIEMTTFDDLLSRSDFVSLHAPLTESSRGLLNRETLARMCPGSCLVNTARGGLVVEADLVAALQSGHLAGAALDVFAAEPLPAGHPLLTLENVVLTSHVAACDTQSIHDMAVGAAQNIVDLYQGRWPGECLVNPTVRATWSWHG